MLNIFEPYPDLPRIDSDEWIEWTTQTPPIGQEFEFVRVTPEGESAPVRAMLRNCCERRAGKTFFTSDPMIVTRDNELIGFGFMNVQQIKWRAVSVILNDL